jgi:hypothetical protein
LVHRIQFLAFGILQTLLIGLNLRRDLFHAPKENTSKRYSRLETAVRNDFRTAKHLFRICSVALHSTHHPDCKILDCLNMISPQPIEATSIANLSLCQEPRQPHRQTEHQRCSTRDQDRCTVGGPCGLPIPAARHQSAGPRPPAFALCVAFCVVG